MRRVMKNHDVPELEIKGEFFRIRRTSESVFSFFENTDLLKYREYFHNVELISRALEWGYGEINLQKPLRKPGKNSGLTPGYWD